jgi:hypothetical protein
MPNPMIRIHDSITDKVIDREMTELEIAELELTRNPPLKDEA